MQIEGFHLFQKRLGRHLQAFRKANHYSQERVGELLGMDRVSIGYIEQGKRAPKLSTLYALTSLYGITLSELFAFEQADTGPEIPDSQDSIC
ncbi:helix-turn-helix domain-containing protein [Coriobacterium glomerans]|uniref:helix-turn-helix domain-containing protein n=1 Tax=Coriobacterium glomerans TaxID=33871 RepID=UPI00067506E5|nr:helix-turn-helix domain-containing protein [Coriobacterium glomerans]